MRNSSPGLRRPVLRQIKNIHLLGLGQSAFSERRGNLFARTAKADNIARSICPYCGVFCGQTVYVKDEKIIDVEGDTDSPISRGRLCPKGAAAFQLVTGSHREKNVLCRRPCGTEWEHIPLDKAMEKVAERVKKTRDETWEAENSQGNPLRRTLGIANRVSPEHQKRLPGGDRLALASWSIY